MSEEMNRLLEENKRLESELLRVTGEKEHLEREIAMAVNLRFHLMPNVYPAFPDIPSVDVYADQIGLAGVGGDFFDFFRIDSDHIGIVIADIFDGGKAAALYMVAFKLYLAGELSMGFTPSEIMGVVNNRLARSNEDDLCLSAWYGVYEISTGKVTAVNAGHETPILCKGGVAEPVPGEAVSYLMAVMEGIKYESYEFYLDPGDCFVLFTDGVIKAADDKGQTFMPERISQVLAGAKDESAEEIVGQLQDELFKHIGDKALPDDASFVCFKRV
jgi:sigma-B regulation protein RsbU (phosphoserine phosphatase)